METTEALILEQKETAEWIKKVLEKYTKEPILRRTKQFVRERLDDLNFHWANFKERDIKIQSQPDYADTHPYAKAKFYEQVEKQFKTIETKLQLKLTELSNEEEQKQNTARAMVNITENPSTDPDTSKKLRHKETSAAGYYENASMNEDQKKRYKRQESQLQALFRSFERIDQGSTSRAYYAHKQQMLRNQWAHIIDTHTEICENSEKDLENEYLMEQEKIEEDYDNIMVKLQEKLDSFEKLKTKEITQLEGTNGGIQQELRLPTLKLPTFTGEYRQWKSFIDLFEQSIHKNEKLGNAQKMHYLKTHVTGDAGKIIQHLPIIESNYETARTALINRYENSRLLVNAQIQVLINQKECQFESAAQLRRIHDTTTECVNSLKGLSIDTTSWDPIILYIISQKLDNDTRKAYEQSLQKPKDLQSLDEFLKFLENKFHALENLEGKRNRQTQEYTKENNNLNKTPRIQGYERKQVLKNYYASTNPNCKLCNGPHWLHSCKKFLQMSTVQRNEIVQREQLCRNCFKADHDPSKCSSYKTCRTCQQKHHTLLHPSEITTTKYQREQSQAHFSAGIKKVLLATAIIKTNLKGCDYYLRALIDQGSQSSFITEDAVQRLQLQRQKTFALVTGLGTMKAGTSNSKVTLKIASMYPSDFQIWGTFLVLNKLTNLLPDESFTHNNWDYIKNLPLADPYFNKQGTIDVLIGADIFQDIIQDGVIKGNHATPVAQNTRLGWILSGNYHDKSKTYNETMCHISNVELHDQLKQFWESEEIEESRINTVEDERCEEIYKQTHRRDKAGRYIVRLPFKENAEKLGKSKDRAMARFLQTEKKFIQNKQLHEDYKKFMKDYLNLGHMELVTPLSNLNKEVYYIPHQAVIKPDNSTTKFRVVFDASCKSSSGISLNDKMLTGPVLQQDLFSILLRWRKHKFVYRADIEKMYRQIKVDHADRDYQRILWRENPSDKIDEYRLTTVTYGTSPAPYLAIKTLQQLAEDEEIKYKLASKITKRDFYVDDLLSGDDTYEAAREGQQEIIKLMQCGGFKLRKWSSNSPALMNGINHVDQEQERFKLNSYDPIKTLGLYWQPETDEFEFKINIDPITNKITKRIIISETARLFDPLGWLTPMIITAKLIQQELWKSEKSWDEILPDQISKKWNAYKQQLHNLEKIKIPRWNKYQTKYKTELHGFCDASEKAYAAVVYTRVITKTGKVFTTLLCAKSKVAPIKHTSLPRLELCGAMLLAKLIEKTKTALEVKDLEIHAWTDSMITLAWLKGDPNKWKNYVANRVNKIKDILNTVNWHHVKGKENPADCASRGICPSKMKAHSIWWKGPEWLSASEIKYTSNQEYTTELEGRREKIKVYTITECKNDDTIYEMLNKYSTIQKLTRVLAYCSRFINNMRKSKVNKRIGSLTWEEIWNATKTVIKKVQHNEFKEEIRLLKKGKQIDKKSKLQCLNAFLDKDDMIRVGGRLTAAKITYSQKHPLIIPHSGPLTTLLITDAHKITLHGGYNLTLTYTRQKYWIINGLSTVKKVIFRCTTCFRQKTKTGTQLMGTLPQARVTKNRPFLHTGVDYAGPMDIRMSKGRGNRSYKGYIAIFICMATKAIHIEVVSDLTANAFIAAFKRLCARRGHVAHLYSDNGTNFVAANKILTKNVQDVEKYNAYICDQLSAYQTQWHFIPPGAPHFGGLWEAGVKSIKYHLKRTIGEHKLTYEELSTLMAQIEACLNSRPLCPMTNDPEELEVLTPGHFLIGTALLAPPDTSKFDKIEDIRTRWQLLQRMHQHFWMKWSSSYLSTLQQRAKWTNRNENIRTNSIVLIKDEQLPPAKWKLGRVTETHAGEDGLVRVATIKTNNKLYKRPLTKICLLPISDNDQQNDEHYSENEQTDKERTISEMIIKKSSENRNAQTVCNLVEIKPDSPQKLNETKKKTLATLPTKRHIEKSLQKQERKPVQDHQEKSHRLKIVATTTTEFKEKKPKIRPTNIPPRPTIEKLMEQHLQDRKRTHTNTKESESATHTNTKESESATKRKRISIPSLILSAALILVVWPLPGYTQVINTPFQNRPGIYFEKMGNLNIVTSNWKIIVYYDKADYWKELNGFKELVNGMNNFCQNKESDKRCKSIVDQFNHQLNIIESKNDLLLRQGVETNKRSRVMRSPFDIIGTVANKLFGVLDEEFARKYEDDIRTARLNDNHLLSLIKNQTTIMESTKNIFKKNSEDINHQLIIFRNHIET